MPRIPDYENYSLVELYQVLNTIRRDLYPEVYEALENELLSRRPESLAELEDCFFALDKERSPEHASQLRQQIEAMGGFNLVAEKHVREISRYATFWRRFWAIILDAIVVGIPLGTALYLLERSGISAIASSLAEFGAQFIALCYYIAMHTAYGQTLGKMVTGVKILHKSEERQLSFAQAVVRDSVPLVFLAFWFVMFVVIASGDINDPTELPQPIVIAAMAALIANFVWFFAEIITMLFNRKRRAVHDFLARTVVVRV